MIPRWMLIIVVALGMCMSAWLLVEFFGWLPLAVRDSAFPCFDLRSCSMFEGRIATLALVFGVMSCIVTALFIALLVVNVKEGEKGSLV